jgi:hypothetical protein
MLTSCVLYHGDPFFYSTSISLFNHFILNILNILNIKRVTKERKHTTDRHTSYCNIQESCISSLPRKVQTPRHPTTSSPFLGLWILSELEDACNWCSHNHIITVKLVKQERLAFRIRRIRLHSAWLASKKTSTCPRWWGLALDLA